MPIQNVLGLDPFCFWFLNWSKEKGKLRNLVTAQPQRCNMFILLWLRAVPLRLQTQFSQQVLSFAKQCLNEMKNNSGFIAISGQIIVQQIRLQS